MQNEIRECETEQKRGEKIRRKMNWIKTEKEQTRKNRREKKRRGKGREKES